MAVVQCLAGPKVIEFGKKRERKYKFKPVSATEKAAVCEVDEIDDLAAMLALPDKFALFDPDSVPAEVMTQINPEIARKAKAFAESQASGSNNLPPPIAVMCQNGESYIDVVLRISLEQYAAVEQQKTHEFAIVPREEADEDTTVGEIPDNIQDQLDAATSTDELRAIAKQVGAKVHHKWDAEKMRQAIVEKVRLGGEAA